MSSTVPARDKGIARFRTRLFTAMMLVVATLTALGFYLAQRKVTADAERNLQAIFQSELSSLHKLEELRHAALADRCNALAAKSRIHAAIEDNAIDLLYPSAKDELRDLMEGEEPPPEQAAQSLHARFYRFLDSNGAVIKPLNPYDVGKLDAKTEVQLALDKLPETQQIGYIQENTEAGGGALLLLGGFVASHLVALRLSVPVKKLALDSEENREKRKRAEAALASTAEELQRSSRYSADASHQLKSPVTVFRIGLESLMAREGFKPEIYEELSALLHQTHRLTHVIDDLLLLSRMDAGHLEIAAKPVNLSQLVDEWLDDLGALPDSPDVNIEKEFPRGLFVTGEKRYTSLIVQNLLENARKYNRPGGRIRVRACGNGTDVVLTVGNTGRTIPPSGDIYERFHHSSTPSAASGHGLGLNLARELARLHGDVLRLVRSENDWTEFEVRFSAADGVNAVA